MAETPAQPDSGSGSDLEIISAHEFDKGRKFSPASFLKASEEARVKRRKMAARQSDVKSGQYVDEDAKSNAKNVSDSKEGFFGERVHDLADLSDRGSEESRNVRTTDRTFVKSSAEDGLENALHQTSFPKSSGAGPRSQIRMLCDFTGSSAPSRNVDAVSLSSLVGAEDLSETYQFNFNVQLPLFLSLLHETFVEKRGKIVFITGGTVFESSESKTWIRKKFNISEAIAPLPNSFASHHTKMMVNLFENGELEIVIMTCNLTALDVYGLTQAVWRSGRLQKGNTNTRSGKTFRFDLLRYLSRYSLSVTKALITILEKYDFSSVDVELVASAPGVYDVEINKSDSYETYGYAKLRQVLERNDLLIKNTDLKHNILSQVTSIAYPYTSKKGATASVFSHILCPLMFEDWHDLAPGARSCKDHQKSMNYAPHIIFPAKKDLAKSTLGYASGGAIHFKYEGSATHKAQYEQNIKPYLCKWTTPGAVTKRENVTPHVKYYASDNGDDWASLKWVMVGSHNLSKQAWGYPKPNTLGKKIQVSSYELSVLIPGGKIVPSYGADTSEGEELQPVRFPFVIPPVRYDEDDSPWSMESSCGPMRDSWGNTYP